MLQRLICGHRPSGGFFVFGVCVSFRRGKLIRTGYAVFTEQRFGKVSVPNVSGLKQTFFSIEANGFLRVERLLSEHFVVSRVSVESFLL